MNVGRLSKARSAAVVVIGLLLVLGYGRGYLHDPVRPGRDLASPLGWWGWFDQSMVLRSTAALAGGNLAMSQQHYPLGYPLLGVPFFWLMPRDPFFLVDLASLLGSFAGFVALGRRLGVAGSWSAPVAAGLFAVTTIGDPALSRQWVLPWSTTPVAACLWLLLAAGAAWIDGRRRPVCVGVLVGLLIACRPSDVILLLPCGAALLGAEWRAWGEAWRERLLRWGWLAVGAGVIVLPVLALHLAIYGPAQTPYMVDSARLGFTGFDFGWKAYVLFIDPTPWFGEGEGILHHWPWIALGVAGTVPALLRGPKERLLGLTLVVHAALYTAYVDLLPTGLWRFYNIHYFAWAIPGYALLAGLLVRDLLHPRVRIRRWVGAGWIAVTLLVLSVRVLPVAVTADERAKAVDFAGPLPPFLNPMFLAPLILKDGTGAMDNWREFRAFVYPGGVRVLGLRRLISGAVEWLPGHAPAGFDGTAPVARWGERVTFLWPPVWMRRLPRAFIPLP